MKFRILFAAAVAIVAAGCTTYSGPTHNTDIVGLANGASVYRVQCQGLLEGRETCVAQAKKICAGKPVQIIGLVDHAASGYKPENDPRELTFVCGAPKQPPIEQPPAPQPVAPVAMPIVERKLTLQGDTNFAVNSAALSPVATRKLDEFIAANRDVNIEKLTISGYTDSTGPSELNNRLSANRARSVQTYLASHGLNAASYAVNGYGKASPVASNASAQGRAKNRRVEIQADGK